MENSVREKIGAQDKRESGASGVWDRIDYKRDAIIEASAGTGKTFALENIVLRLVCGEGYDVPELLLVTYTDKAAGELRNRIRKALADAGRLDANFNEMTICTIHSFCKRILDEYAFESGMPMRCEICSSPAELHLRAAQRALRDDEFTLTIGPELLEAAHGAGEALSLQKLVSDACDGFESPAERREYLRSSSSDPQTLSLVDRFRALMHRHSDAIKSEEGVMTYDDLVAKAADVATRSGAAADRLRSSIRRRYRVALVDEFQDTDEWQWALFRALFSSANNASRGERGGLLIAVGDPKQAIYSFRGADVAVYCEARKEIAEEAHGAPLTLDATYRSTRSLVAAFNTMFAATSDGGGWFGGGAAGEGIGYSPVKYPDGNPKFKNLAETDEIAPVVLLESLPPGLEPSGSNAANAHLGNTEICLPCFAAAAAVEMENLRRFRGGSDDAPLTFKYGQMCVLVTTSDEAEVVRAALARRGIPYSQYKQKGVFASAVAEGVAALLDYAANPAAPGRRNALLASPLFGIHPSRLLAPDEDFDARFSAFTERLGRFSAECDWVRFFECVMNDDCSALAVPTPQFPVPRSPLPVPDISEFNRTRAAARQIFDKILCDPIARRSRSAEELSRIVRRWRLEDATERENASLYDKESAADRVQIMTIHASKGLQFPIVFVATGFGKPRKDSAQERRRLLYVAITRAEHRVYLPWSNRAWKWQRPIPTAKNPGRVFDGCGIGSAGADLATGGFLADAILRLQREGFIPSVPRSQSPVPSSPFPVPSSPFPVPNQTPITLLDVPPLRDKRLHWESFTSLHNKLSAQDAEPHRPDDLHDLDSHDPSVMAPTLLPRSNISGNVFHEIMETLCCNDENAGQVGFTNACTKQCEERLAEIVRNAMARNALPERTDESGNSTSATLLRLVRAALATRLTFSRDSFRLCEIPRRDRLAEVDFVLDPGSLQYDAAKALGVDALPNKTLLNGKIDLIARRGNNAFIFDWKTNSLANYSQDAVAQAMDSADYHLQYGIYTLAAAEWLIPRGLNISGVAYLFVRAPEYGIPTAAVFLRNFTSS